MLIDVSGEFLTSEPDPQELAARADIAMIAWNIAILPKSRRNPALNKLIKKMSPLAPNQEAIDSLKAEISTIIKRKIALYPSSKEKLDRVDVVDKGGRKYTIRAYHYGGNGEHAGLTA